MTIDPLVTPVLSDAQKKVWRGLQKVGVYWGFAGMLGGFANDGDALEVELGGPARAEQIINGINVQMYEKMQPQVKMQPDAPPPGRHSHGATRWKAGTRGRPEETLRAKRLSEIREMISIRRRMRTLLWMLTVFVIACGGGTAFGQDEEIVDDRPIAPEANMAARLVRAVQFSPEQVDQWVFNR